MMDHGLRTISYIADIGDLVVIMARRRLLPQVILLKVSWLLGAHFFPVGIVEIIYILTKI